MLTTATYSGTYFRYYKSVPEEIAIVIVLMPKGKKGMPTTPTIDPKSSPPNLIGKES
jgi:hypothetical protein